MIGMECAGSHSCRLQRRFRSPTLRRLEARAGHIALSISIHLCVHVYLHIYIYTYLYIFIYIYIHVHVHIYIYMYIYIHTWIYICVCMQAIEVPKAEAAAGKGTLDWLISAMIHIYLYINIYLCIYLCLYLYLYLYQSLSNASIYIYTLMYLYGPSYVWFLSDELRLCQRGHGWECVWVACGFDVTCCRSWRVHVSLVWRVLYLGVVVIVCESDCGSCGTHTGLWFVCDCVIVCESD